MAQATQSKKKLWLIILLLVLLLAVAAYLVNLQKAKQIYFGYESRAAFASEVKKLRDPLNTLGFSGVNKRPSHCTKNAIYFGSESTPIECTTAYQKYVVIGKDTSTKNLFNSKAAELDSLMKQNGWTVKSYAAPSLTAWFQGVLAGKDYYPDIGGYKNTAHAHCGFDINVAYSNPKPVAFNIQMHCDSPALDAAKGAF